MSREACPKCSSSTALGSYKCFKCGYTMQSHSTQQYTAPRSSILPIPEGLILNPHRFHSDAIAWLARAHIYNATIVAQGIGYCPSTHKVFIPAYDRGGDLRFYQLRALDTKVAEQYKYITYGKSSEYLIHYEDHKTHDLLVLVEDHLSAIRLRKYANVVCLSGTHLKSVYISGMLERYTKYILWLDPDEAGLSAMQKTIKSLKYYANLHNRKLLFSGQEEVLYSFYCVNYDKIKEDPKKLTNTRISDIITNKGQLWTR